MPLRFSDECFLFDLSDRGRMITGRAPSVRLKQMREYAYQYVNASAWEEICAFLQSFRRAVLLVRTEEGVAVIRSDLMPAASIGILQFPFLDAKVLDSLMNGRETVLWDRDEPFPFEGKRKSQKQEKGILLLEAMIREGDLCLGAECFENTEVNLTVAQRVKALSEYVGCPVRFLSSEEEPFPTEWDAPSFTAFLLVALCFCRRYVPDREMELSVSQGREECTALLRMSLGNIGADSVTELDYLRHLADKKVMLFERTRALTFLQLRIAPIRRDFAYLGLKKPPHRLSKDK